MTRDSTLAGSVSEQASHWWVVLHGEDVSAEEQREFVEWVSQSPERVAMYLKTALLMHAARSSAVKWPESSAEALIRDARAAAREVVDLSSYRAEDGPSHHEPESVTKSTKAGGRRKRRFLVTSLVASLAAMGVALSLYLNRPIEFQTAFGEQRSVLLEDGSRVTLNTASKISVDLRPDRRVIHLLRGEALFEVAHDIHRPFDVQSGQTTVRAVGTQFDVDMRAKTTTVTVVEGRVAVVSDVNLTSLLGDLPVPGIPSPASVPKGLVILSPADRFVITSAGAGSTQHLANGAAATSWTTHQLIFEHRPLSEVAEEFNRYNKRRIEISSADLQKQEVTGVFQYNDPESFLAFLSQVPGVDIRQARDGHQVVTSRVADPAQVP